MHRACGLPEPTCQLRFLHSSLSPFPGFGQVSGATSASVKALASCCFFIATMEAFNYDAARWHRLRDRVMRRDNYQCQLSKRYGKIKPAELVHHIFPVADYPEYAYCSWNLISLSRDMHNKLHNRMTDELTNMGKDLLRQTARKQGIQI